jgi:hypothetical protein
MGKQTELQPASCPLPETSTSPQEDSRNSQTFLNVQRPWAARNQVPTPCLARTQSAEVPGGMLHQWLSESPKHSPYNTVASVASGSGTSTLVIFRTRDGGEARSSQR